MTRYARTAGALIEPVGHLWVAFSQRTGETALLNDESAAILEILESGPADTPQVCAQLSVDSGVTAVELVPLVAASWVSLVDAGLVHAVPEPVTIAA
jgi:PqqD family protein of HPr-rel-A system